jgi:MOSC domain-containing protein YiiM
MPEASLPVGRIVSLQVGMPRKLTTATGREWETAIVKEPVAGTVALGKENFTGDYQANRRYHGGPDKAVCGYCAEHYPEWRAFVGKEMPYGAFGENITVEGLTEDLLCIGDTLQAGEVLLQISQPRQPCVNVSKRWASPKLPRRMEETGYTGFYCRVLQTGDMASGETLVVIARPHPEWTLARANAIMYAATPDPDAITALRAVPLLSAEWKRILRRKLAKITEE